MNSKIMQMLALVVLKMPISQCENLTVDKLCDKLGISHTEAMNLIELLHQEHVIRYKYTYECDKCGEMDTVFEDEKEFKKYCNICESTIDINSLMAGARIRYVLDKNDFTEYMEEEYPNEFSAAQKGKRPIMEGRQEKHDNCISEDIVQMNEQKKYRMFISHASCDAEYVEAFVRFLEELGLTNEEVFCSSIQGYGIPWGGNIYDYLASEFKDANKELLVLFMLSKNFYTRPACLNEMGAAWILKKEYRSMLLPGFEYSAIEGAIDPNKIGIKFDDSELMSKLNDVRTQLGSMFELRDLNPTQWDGIRQRFINKINEIKGR